MDLGTFLKEAKMKKVRNTLCIILSVSVFAAIVDAEEITIFDADATITDGNAYDTVVVKGDGTVVDMTGGEVSTLITMNASNFNMSGGIVGQSASYKHGIRAYDSSILNLSGGQVSRMYSCNQAEVNILGNATVGSYCSINQSSVITVMGDAASIGSITAMNSSKFRLLAGTCGTANLYGVSTLEMSGGSVDYVHAYWDAAKPNLNISGGTIRSFLYLGSDGITRISGGTIEALGNLSVNGVVEQNVEIIGYDLAAVPYGGTHGCGQITGYWNDAADFTINLYTPNDYSIVTLYDSVGPVHCLPCPGDLNGDCWLSPIDVSTLVSMLLPEASHSYWLQCPQ